MPQPETLDPLAAGKAIKDAFLEYLETTHEPRDHARRAEFRSALTDRFKLSRGPFLQAAAPYQASGSISGLVADGILSEEFLRLPDDVFPADRPLYTHQEHAIRKMIGRRNLVVATGTGSGKTECFLFPILNHLLTEATAGTLSEPGVRALLLYPMNALANDQMKRLRSLLKGFPEVTFGRYVGDTKEQHAAAYEAYRSQLNEEPLGNERISREAIREQPPHILLTNYAMLEYLLLRPEDTSLFDGPKGRHWKFIVLDEVHVYNGARGAEIAMLLRRVRDRVSNSEPGSIAFMGTSATLGGGQSAVEEVAGYASQLFGEPVEHLVNDPSRQDVILPVVDPLVHGEITWTLDESLVEDLHRRFTADEALQGLIPGTAFPNGEPSGGPSEYLWTALSRESHVVQLQEWLESGSVEVEEMAKALFDDPAPVTKLTLLVDLCVKATPSDTEAPLIPAKYHFMLRAMEGAFLCLSDRHPTAQTRLELNRHVQCPSCRSDGVDSQMFEYAICASCGTSYLVGKLDQDDEDGSETLRQANPFETGLYYLLVDTASLNEDEENEDEAAFVKDDEVEIDRDERVLCTKCGDLAEGSERRCECNSPHLVRVEVAHPTVPDAPLRKCVACSSRSPSGIVRRFVTYQDRPQTVIASALYQSLPASALPELAHKVGEGRKLISFSDSRQDAAFFASYMERSYSRSMQRHLIWAALQGLPDDEIPRFEDLVPRVKNRAQESLVLDPDDGMQNTARVRHWLMREVLGVDRRESLDGIGLAEITVAIPRQVQAPPALQQLGFSDDECMDLVRVLLDTVRIQAGVYVPEDVDIADPLFAPRNVVNRLRSEGPNPSRHILSWQPGKGANGRLDYLKKVFGERGIEVDPEQVLSDIWNHWLTAPNNQWRAVLKDSTGREGTVFALNPESIEFRLHGPNHPAYRCNSCRKIWWRSVSQICPAFRCHGRLDVVEPDELARNHYRRLYTELLPVGMTIEEHTGQLSNDRARQLQQKFLDGEINALSCSTTFELGVDVGEVQAILMRNVPPSPANYVQRAGRAGRRLGSTALIVTFAQRRNHDLQYFEDPKRMIDGIISSPIISLENPQIVRRHLHAVAFAAYERRHVEQGGEPHRTVESFFSEVEEGEAAVDKFVAWLRECPEELGSALLRITPEPVHGELGVGNWKWVDALVEENDQQENYGWLTRARDEFRDDLARINKEIDEAKGLQGEHIAARNDPMAQAMGRRLNAHLRVRRTISQRRLMDYLAQRVVLPKYGFPVDVAVLEVQWEGDPQSGDVQLSRDMRQAITDYAPGARTVANKSLWESVGLKVPTERGLLEYRWSICANCEAFSSSAAIDNEPCAVCGADETKGSGKFIQPIFGFIGKKSKEKPGETRPQRIVSSQSHFSDYAGHAPDFEELSFGELIIRRRFSRQGQITVLTRGRGFRVCTTCGYATSQPPQKKRAKNQSESHERPPGNRGECRGFLVHRELGHQYLTDVVELQIPTVTDWKAAWSTAYALLAATPTIGIATGDVDGTLRSNGPGEAPSLIIFDTVPGGAGHVKRFVERLGDLTEAALNLVLDCECGEDTSCYACLRSYSNQSRHDELSRSAAVQILEPLNR